MLCLVCEGNWYVILNFIAALSEVIPNKYYSYVGLKNYLGSIPFSIFGINFTRLVLFFSLTIWHQIHLYIGPSDFFISFCIRFGKLFFQDIYSFYISI